MAQKELKTEKISVKLTMSEKFAITRYAKESGVSVSSYMVMKAMQKDGLTPALLVKIQNLLNVAIISPFFSLFIFHFLYLFFIFSIYFFLFIFH